MRLYNIQTTKFEIIDDANLLEEPYAILSHTWAQPSTSELTYQHWVSWLRKDYGYEELVYTSGFLKILSACALAEKRGYSRIWIDTICIDKSSSSELSEAINSMFAYYKRANICLAYLSDVELMPAEIENNREKALINFEESRWFTRAWTLQELLAPQSIEFLDKNWVHIGNKESLEARIAAITGIEELYLHSPDEVFSANIAQRMSWAAKRQATRIEDKAYCLLGIFDINMPLLYGEKDKAFHRLQEEIMKISTDHSLFAWEWLPSYKESWYKSTLMETNGGWVSFLAPNISCFANVGSLTLLSPKKVNLADETYSMTNLGLRICLPIIRTCSNLSYALLNVSDHDCSYRNVLGIPIYSFGGASGGVVTRCAWPARLVPLPWIVERSFHYRDVVFAARQSYLRRIGSKLEGPEYYKQTAFGLTSLHPGNISSAFQILFFGLRRFQLDKIVKTRGVYFQENHNMLEISSLQQNSSFQADDHRPGRVVPRQPIFQGALFFIRRIDVKSQRLLKMLVGNFLSPNGASTPHLTISHESSPETDLSSPRISRICAEIQDRTPSEESIRSLFPENAQRRRRGRLSTETLVYSEQGMYQAAIAAPVDTLAYGGSHQSDSSTGSEVIKPFPVFIWADAE